jgi:prepilin-type N-terminal cleavage/methylation domain-containing protein
VSEKRARKSDAGMTLVEVLLAVAILGVALVVMLTAITRCLAVLRVSDDYHKAMWALSMGEAEHPLIAGRDTKPQDLAVSDVVYEGIGYSRFVDDPDETAPDSNLRLVLVTTRLEWEGRGNRQRIEVPQYLLFRE